MKTSQWIALTITGAALVILGVTIPDWMHPFPQARQFGAAGTSLVQFAPHSPWDASLKSKITDRSDAAFISAHPQWSSDPAMQAAVKTMQALTVHLNKDWARHVGARGVTCYTCHRGEAVPPETWFSHPASTTPAMIARSENWNKDAATVRAFFPDNSWALYLLQDEPIRAQSATALAGNTVASQIEVKRVYELMMQMSDGIGVNCGYCHNSRAFADWSQSTPNRWIGHDAIAMTRDINANYLVAMNAALNQTRQPVKINTLAVAPQRREPQAVDGFTVCATCHYGHPKPQDAP